MWQPSRMYSEDLMKLPEDNNKYALYVWVLCVYLLKLVNFTRNTCRKETENRKMVANAHQQQLDHLGKLFFNTIFWLVLCLDKCHVVLNGPIFLIGRCGADYMHDCAEILWVWCVWVSNVVCMILNKCCHWFNCFFIYKILFNKTTPILMECSSLNRIIR